MSQTSPSRFPRPQRLRAITTEVPAVQAQPTRTEVSAVQAQPTRKEIPWKAPKPLLARVPVGFLVFLVVFLLFLWLEWH